jgi:uncharacterized protein YcbK (DUF882 family)
MRLSKNFSLKEFTRSETAAKLGINNVPSEAIVANLEMLVLRVLQPARDFLGPLTITSGYRSMELNAAVGGAEVSQHLFGEAADVKSKNVSTYELACWIRDNCEFDQLILEYYDDSDPHSGWVHVSFTHRRPNRNEVLTIGKGTTKRGIHK